MSEAHAGEATVELRETPFCGIVTVGERGQVVIPIALRKDCDIAPGDRLIAFRAPVGGGIVLAKMEVLRDLLSNLGLSAGPLPTVDEEAPE